MMERAAGRGGRPKRSTSAGKTASPERDILSHIPFPVVCLDASLNFVRVNRAYADAQGQTPDFFPGKSYLSIQPDTVDESALRQVVKTGEPYGVSEKACTDPGQPEKGVLYRDVSVQPQKNARGKVTGLVMTMVDRTERRRAREALKESQERLLTVLESITDAFFTLDREWRITYANAAAERLWQRNRENLVGKGLFTEVAPKAVGSDFWQQYHRAVTEQVPVSFEALSPTLGIWLEAHAYPSKDGLSVFARDISDRKKAEEVRARLEEELRQAQKMEAIGTLAGGIAHDFNNVLAAIIGFTQMVLEDVPKDSPFSRDLGYVLRAGVRGRELVRQILTFSRQGEQQRAPVQPLLSVREGLKLLRATLPSTIELRQDLRGKGIVLGEPTHIQQILVNLATNAAHAMREDGGVLLVELEDVSFVSPSEVPHPSLKPGSYVMLRVSDTGTGMRRGVLERVFDPFFTTKALGEGTGLGLSVVHGIVRSYGGTITAESKPGHGSTFRVYFPAIVEERPVEERPGAPVPLGHERILLVDDEEALVEMAREMLKRLGYEVVGVTSGREALNLFMADPRRFDLVITDYTMPHMAGIELVQRLIGVRPDLPILLCTGFSESVSADIARRAGCRSLLVKPLTRQELAGAVRDALDNTHKQVHKAHRGRGG